MTTEPRIYVASLTDYNAGRLVGVWVDVTDPDEMNDEITAMLAAATAAHPEDGIREEYAVHDFEGTPNFGEYPSLDWLCNWNDARNELASFALDQSAFDVWYDNEDRRDIDATEMLNQFRDSFAGVYDSLEDYAWEMADVFGWLTAMEDAGINSSYFDADQYATDLRCGGDVRAARVTGGGLAVFRSF